MLVEDVLLWRRRCFFVLYATSKTNPLGVEYQIIPSQTPLLGHEKKSILHSIFLPLVTSKTPLFWTTTPL
jgi:hypothetical protein